MDIPRLFGFLLEADADPNEPCGWVEPWHIAAQNGHAETARLPLDFGKVLINAISLFKSAVRGDIGIPALHVLALTREFHPPAAIKVGTMQSESHKAALKWHAFFNPEVHKILEIDLLRNLKFEHRISSIKFSGDGEYIAAYVEDRVGVFDAVTGQQIGGVEITKRKRAHPALRNLCFSPDSSHLVGSIDGSSLWLWDISTSISSDFHASHPSISAVLYTPDGRSVVTGCHEGTINVWDISGDGQAVHTYTLDHGNGINSLAISPDGQYLVIGNGLGNIALWDIKNRPALTAQHERAQDGIRKIECLSFSSDGCHLICRHDGGTNIHSLEWIPGAPPDDPPRLGKVTKTLSEEQVEGKAGRFITADEQWLLSRQPVGKIIIQDAVNGQVQAVLQAHASNVRSLICSSAGYMFATASDHEVRILKMSKI
ncbi:WD40-repeat-containing domain protein [Aspergillus pseudodeflectus]|uniref:WD40-repeat-containing domain protein n=1 Tax=Aspergillus pseudodeflectus TaxID=176178 RepID=A0ABR4JS36_9EURO